MATTNAEKQAAFRHRQQKELDQLRTFKAEVVKWQSQADVKAWHWFDVQIELVREGKTGKLRYIMEAAEALRLIADREDYPSSGRRGGIYAYAASIWTHDFGDGRTMPITSLVSGTIAVAFEDMMVATVDKVDSFQVDNASSYNICKMAALLARVGP